MAEDDRQAWISIKKAAAHQAQRMNRGLHTECPRRSGKPGMPVVDGFAAGHGITGMRERVALYDGTFQAGPGPEGGFTVKARFPA